MKIGFIGLGIMGKPMCKNLLKAGYQLVIIERNKTVTEELVAAGAEAAASPKAVAEKTDIITCGKTTLFHQVVLELAVLYWSGSDSYFNDSHCVVVCPVQNHV